MNDTANSDIAMNEQSHHYKVIAKAIEFIRTNALSQPSLTEVSAAVHMSEAHLQRVFTQWAGISPKRFLQYLTKEHAKQVLKNNQDVLSVADEVGLSGGGRLYDLMINCEGMTPGEVKQQGDGVIVQYGISDTPFGQALLGWTERGLCFLVFVDDFDLSFQRLKTEWSKAELKQNNRGAETIIDKIFRTRKGDKLSLLLRGTNFQIKVWEAVLKSHPGQLLTYSQLAEVSGNRKAQRAVGSALGANPIGLLIPCHRVIRGTGELGNYRWGIDRKVAIQAWEQARSDP